MPQAAHFLQIMNKPARMRPSNTSTPKIFVLISKIYVFIACVRAQMWFGIPCCYVWHVLTSLILRLAKHTINELQTCQTQQQDILNYI